MLQDTLNVLRRQFLGLNRVLSTITELVQDGLAFDDEDALLKYANRLLINNHNFQFGVIHKVVDNEPLLVSAVSSDAILDPKLKGEENASWVATCHHLARQLLKDKTLELVTRHAGQSTYYATPIIYRDTCLATLIVNAPSFDDNHPKLISIYANILTSVIINTRQNHLLNQEVRRRTEELEAAWHMADASSRTKSQFLTNISHEFLTPLNAIVGASALLSETEMPGEQRDYVASITDASEDLKSMVSGMLDYTLSENGQLIFKSEVVNLKDLADRLMEKYQPMAAKKNLVITLLTSPEVPLQVLVDPKRLMQILGNLISNAIKFTEEGHITIDLNSKAVSPVEAVITFSVIDTGIGIDTESCTQIFDAFHQLDGSASRKHEGSGLGLAISQKIAGLMGAEIKVASRPGQGSTFSFEMRVPLDLPYIDTKKTKRPSTPNLSAETHFKVLLVEDNLINQKLARKLLEKMGCKVDIANDGLDALAMFRCTPYDVIFMDCQMPNMDGYEATTKIRAMESGTRTPIIALTANSLPEDRARSYQVGMDEFLTKPIVREKLQSALTKWTTH